MNRSAGIIVIGIFGVFLFISCIVGYSWSKGDNAFESPFNTNSEKVEPVAIKVHEEKVVTDAGLDYTDPNYIAGKVQSIVMVTLALVMFSSIITSFFRFRGGM